MTPLRHATRSPLAGNPNSPVERRRALSGKDDALIVERRGLLVHMVGRITESVFAFLGPTTDALAQSGVRQTVILLDDPLLREHLPKFHPSVRLRLIRADQGLIPRLREALNALREEARTHPVVAAHLHGYVPCLMGAYVARVDGLGPSVYFSPHGSKSLANMRGWGALLLWAARPLSRRVLKHSIANVTADVDTLKALTRRPVDVVECPVDPAFFAPRVEARRPLIVGGSDESDSRGGALFAQLAVLLTEESSGVSFNWTGSANFEAKARLKAANVGIIDAATIEQRAGRLGAGWVFVAAGEVKGFPLALAEAMSAGLPCVAWDTPHHRDLVVHGKTGYLCSSTNELVDCVERLIVSKALRAQIGEAAKAEAVRRFDGRNFRSSLLASYRGDNAQPAA